ncbi:CU044_5270 family protein [Amycolatopsis mongoliensis]|uniref:CU044_5270 family protein n=1 Tax=Amycolatopsis mongoliensis TaxID=715475 RepID=A0A9Y2JVN9_9PSEU|nr:CU044_5270 family protein [Amycolatopsis sp. 4-36]WIY04357.1 CU044_5270 family protein [Amycolatopsis sp. 4-36]
MTDLETLRAALLPDEPAQDVVDRSRHRLQNHMLGRRRKRVLPLAIGAGLAAAAAAVAVVVTAVPGPPAPPPPPQAVAPVDPGRQILLAAATAAERAQVGAGKYWHTTTKVGKATWEYWTTTDGQEWYRGEITHGKAKLLPRARPIRINGDDDVTLSTILALPADPAALRDWLADGLTRHGTPANQRDTAVLQSLIDLVSTVPAPPAVRAAAFRAIAAYPDVSALPDGKGVRLPGGGRLVVDPATGQVDGSSVFLGPDGQPAHDANGDTYAVSGEWTDDLPQ